MFYAKFIVRGTVQGVNYRSFVKRIASTLPITGYAKNLLGGDVEVFCEADEKKTIEIFKQAINKKPITPFERIDVEEISGDIKEGHGKQYHSFEVID